MQQVNYRLSENLNISDERRFSSAAHFLVGDLGTLSPAIQNWGMSTEPITVDAILRLGPKLEQWQRDCLVTKTISRTDGVL